MRMSRKLAMGCGGIPLKTLAVGSSVWLNENETAAEYIVLAHDYPVSGGTLVMRKIAIGSITMNASTPTTYVDTDLDVYLNGDFLATLDASVQKCMMVVPVTCLDKDSAATTVTRKVYLLSRAELGGTASEEGTAIPYFSDDSRKICYAVDATAVEWWTRTIYYSWTTYFRTVGSDGAFTTQSATGSCYVRPVFTLPGNFKIKNK